MPAPSAPGPPIGPVIPTAERFDADHGMKLISHRKFAEAAAYCSKHLEGNAVAHYGLATSLFRADVANLDLERLREISDLYETAIQLAPEFADAYFMCGMAYNAMAGLQLRALKDCSTAPTPAQLEMPTETLRGADAFLVLAEHIDPRLGEVAGNERETTERLRATLDRLSASLA